MPWADKAEMPVVKRQYARNVEALGHGHDRGVDEADVAVGVLVDQLHTSCNVVTSNAFQPVTSRCYVS